MKTLATSTNIVETLVFFLKGQEEIQGHLSNGDLYEFERALSDQISEAVTEATSQILNDWVADNCAWLVDTYKAAGFSRCEMRKVEIQVQTGGKISVNVPIAIGICPPSGKRRVRHPAPRQQAFFGTWQCKPPILQQGCHQFNALPFL